MGESVQPECRLSGTSRHHAVGAPIKAPIPTDQAEATRFDEPLAVPRSPMVGSVRRAIVALSLWSCIAWLAVGLYRDPRRAVQALRMLREARGPTPGWRAQKLAFASGRYFWDFYAPGWPSVAFDRYIERELDRLIPILGRPPALQSVILAITRRCALQCEHCCEGDVLNRHETLSPRDLGEIARRVQRRGVAQLFLSGGEPIHRLDAVLALTASVSAETDVWIISSGQGLSAERAERLRGAGLTGVALSLDHWDAATHDAFRGRRGVFDAVEDAATNARRAGLLVALSLCPTRAFVSSDSLWRYGRVARRLGASFIQILEPRSVGRYAGQSVALEPEQQRELERFTLRLNLDPAERDLPAVAYLDSFARAHGCPGAGDRYVYIDTAGDLHPCPFCRRPGVRVLDHDIDEAIGILQTTGCPARTRRMASRAESSVPVQILQ